MLKLKSSMPRGIRGKLITIFVLIKVLPLLLLAWFAWHSAQNLGERVADEATDMTDSMLSTIRTVGDSVTEDAIRALDARSREAIESLTTETARQIATFLYERDADILSASSLEPTAASYRRFLEHRRRDLFQHGAYQLSEDQKSWIPVQTIEREALVTRRISPDNSKDFNARAPEYLGERERRPLFVEMTFIGLDGLERVKVTTNGLIPATLGNVAERSDTFVRAETYWPELQKLKPGEIYVSDVIGAYVPSPVIGPYTPASAEKAGVPFAPEQSAYAGTENPVGKRFKGIVRWATPVITNGQLAGYVTLALDHDHIRQFSDRIVPTEERYTPIIDAIKGNYAFIWDHKSRSISHPRDYFIVGYDPQTGDPVPPWLDTELYAQWQQSKLPAHQFLADVEPFHDQNLTRKPALEMIKARTVALDCRYLNYSPQCEGWKAVTEHGGSGSFLIYFSGLWKLTTAAAIPYYTGQYGATRQGFGFVTIGANVDDFHRAATESGQRIATLIDEKDTEFKLQRTHMLDGVVENLSRTAWGLAGSTIAMTIIVIVIAILMANFLTTRITRMIAGIHRFEGGDLKYRLQATSEDEMGDLARSFNTMADTVEESFKRLDEARVKAEDANRSKSEFLAVVSHELRTPLNGILGFSEVLEMEASDEAHAEYARTINDSGKHLLLVVNDLLDLSKIEAGRMELNTEQVPILPLVEEVCGLHRAEAERKGLSFELSLKDKLPVTVVTDPLRLKQILNNLLNNAIKFTAHGQVGLTLEADADQLVFTVSDTGCGIPQTQHALIFEKFRQADSFTTRRYGGTGLGLALATEFASLMGGSITVESAPDKGSSFRLHLPLRPRSATAEART